MSRTTGLLDGDIVTFRITGGPPKAYVWVKECGVAVLQCLTGSADTLGCRPGGRPPGTTDAGRMDGEIALSVTFTTIGGSTVDCRPAGSCELIAFASRVRGPDTVRASLSFDPKQPLP